MSRRVQLPGKCSCLAQRFSQSAKPRLCLPHAFCTPARAPTRRPQSVERGSCQPVERLADGSVVCQWLGVRDGQRQLAVGVGFLLRTQCRQWRREFPGSRCAAHCDLCGSDVRWRGRRRTNRCWLNCRRNGKTIWTDSFNAVGRSEKIWRKTRLGGTASVAQGKAATSISGDATKKWTKHPDIYLYDQKMSNLQDFSLRVEGCCRVLGREPFFSLVTKCPRRTHPIWNAWCVFFCKENNPVSSPFFFQFFLADHYVYLCKSLNLHADAKDIYCRVSTINHIPNRLSSMSQLDFGHNLKPNVFEKKVLFSTHKKTTQQSQWGVRIPRWLWSDDQKRHGAWRVVVVPLCNSRLLSHWVSLQTPSSKYETKNLDLPMDSAKSGCQSLNTPPIFVHRAWVNVPLWAVVGARSPSAERTLQLQEPRAPLPMLLTCLPLKPRRLAFQISDSYGDVY